MKQTPRGMVSARRGFSISVLVACVVALRPRSGRSGRPELSFQEVELKVSELCRRKVANATVRSVIYRHNDLFERVAGRSGVTWRLSNKGSESGS